MFTNQLLIAMKRINNKLEKHFPSSNSIILLHAHPDDESFLSAGLINELCAKRNCLIIYCAAALIDGVSLGTIRQKEALMSCRRLGLKNHPLYLDYCESRYSQTEKTKLLFLENPKTIAKSIWQIVKRQKYKVPLTVISYDKNGGYGNKDHVVLHQAGRSLFETHPEVENLYEVTICRENMLDWLKKARKRLDKSSLPKLSYWVKNFGLSKKEIQFYFELSKKQVDIKRKALNDHKSQISVESFPLNINYEDFRKVFGKEYLHKVSR